MTPNSHFYSVFKNGITPHLLYITCQDFDMLYNDRPLHRHESLCELNFIYRGHGIYNIGGDSYQVKSGDLLFYNRGEEHELIAPKEGHLSVYCMGFTNVQFKDLPYNHIVPDKAPRVCSSGIEFGFLRSLAEHILNCDLEIEYENSLRDLLASSFLMISTSLCDTSEAEPVSSEDSAVADAVKEYISEHFKEDISLDSISAALNFSSSHISHLFKKVTGYSPTEYLIRRRIGYAQTLLISSDYSVTHIATLSGFNNPSHFQTTFKKVVGDTPLQYRISYLNALRGNRNQA